MAIEDYDIVGSYNKQRVQSIDAERTINMFEYIDPLGKKPKSLINTSGLDNTNYSFVGATNGFRGQFVFDNFQYCVIGDNVYRIASGGIVTKLNSTPLSTTIGYVAIDANTFQIIFVDGSMGYIWDTIAQTFTQITDSSFPPEPVDVCYLDGFFVVAHGGTNNFQLSSYEQGLVWGPASNFVTSNNGVIPNQLIVGASDIGGVSGTPNFETGVTVNLVIGAGGALPGGLSASVTYYAIFVDATHIKLATTYTNAIAGTAVVFGCDITPLVTVVSLGQLQQGSITTHPGTIVACRTLHRRLFLFSQYFTEVWENAGIGTNLPFRRNNSLLMEYGTPCVGSISVGFDIMTFLSQTRDGLGSVMQVAGSQAIPISTRAIDFQFAQYAALQQIEDCRAFLIKENGLIFYRMNFTLANHTWVYNITLSDPSADESKLWHEEEVLNGDRHPAQTHAYFNGINYVGHYSSPILYTVNSNTFTNAGENIRRTRIGRPIVPKTYQRLRIDRFQLDLLQGNAALINNTVFPLDIYTENGFSLQTESGNDLLLEQGLIVPDPLEPFVFLSISKDGGQTYGYTVSAPMGNIGQRTFRTLWRKLGTIPRGQAFTPKIEFFTAIPFIILGASWSFEVMPE